MNKAIIIIIITIRILFAGCLHGQTPPVDSATFGNKWPLLTTSMISNDGSFMYYTVNSPLNKQDSLYIKSTDAQWEKNLQNIKSPIFTQDSRQIVFQRNDTVFLVGLGNNAIEYIDGIEGDFVLQPYSANDNLLIYRLKQNSKTLITRLLSSKEIRSYPTVENYWFNPSSGALLILTKTGGPEIAYHLKKVIQSLVQTEDLWQGPKVENLVFNSDGTQFAFLVSNEQGGQSLWYYDMQKKNPINLLSETSTVIDKSLKIASIFGISKHNEKVYLTLQKIQKEKYVSVSGVDIYGYKDPKLQSQQLLELEHPEFYFPQTFKAIVSISNGHFLQLEQEGEQVTYPLNLSSLPDSWTLLIKHGVGDFRHEWYWNKDAEESVFLLSLNSGDTQVVYKNLPYEFGNRFYLSPDEKHVLYFDRKKLNYYSLDIATGVRKNITGNIRTKWAPQNPDVFRAIKNFPFGIGGFTKDGSALIYDEYDIFKVDLEGQKSPVNLTSSFGRVHKIRFRTTALAGIDPAEYDSNKEIYLKAFDEGNKNVGFCKITLNKSSRFGSIKMLNMGIAGSLNKARDANAYAIKLMDANSSPNLFFSTDLRTFAPVSNVHPEKKYNWLTSELITWQLPDGRKSQGILYKPENFDPHKKYPIIFHYYHQKSDQLHSFILPHATGDEINISFFVSNGYLVFLPDIHYTMGMPGSSALDAVVSAADVLAKRPYVDVSKMGLQGHSFGGFETNYIIAHTTRFAAAMSSCGMSDMVSLYGSLVPADGASRARQFEVDHDRIGGSLWEMPEKYIENSPVLRADKITTPLLMMANHDDNDVPPAQGIELFTALRRLQKKAWLLQYDTGKHGVFGENAKDYTIRIFQFFNYYLKDAPPPKWMTEGVPASEKRMFSRLELDYSGKKP